MTSAGASFIDLTFVKSLDPWAKNIIETVGEVGLAKFKYEKMKWMDAKVQGTLVVYGRHEKPYYSFLIINKTGMNNYLQPITTCMDVRLCEKNVLFRNKLKSGICLIYFTAASESRMVATTLQDLTGKANIPVPVVGPPGSSSLSNLKQLKLPCPTMMDLKNNPKYSLERIEEEMQQEAMERQTTHNGGYWADVSNHAEQTSSPTQLVLRSPEYFMEEDD